MTFSQQMGTVLNCLVSSWKSQCVQEQFLSPKPHQTQTKQATPHASCSLYPELNRNCVGVISPALATLR